MIQQKLHCAKDRSGRVICLADLSGYKPGDRRSSSAADRPLSTRRWRNMV